MSNYKLEEFFILAHIKTIKGNIKKVEKLNKEILESSLKIVELIKENKKEK